MSVDKNELEKSLPAAQKRKVQNQIQMLQDTFPDIWDILLRKQSFCPSQVGLPNFCDLDPDKDKCIKCWKNALKFNPEIGVSVSPAGRFICSDCKKYLVCIGEESDGESDDSSSKKYVWECIGCGKKYLLELDAKNAPKGYQIIAEDSEVKKAISNLPPIPHLNESYESDESDEPDEDDSDA